MRCMCKVMQLHPSGYYAWTGSTGAKTQPVVQFTFLGFTFRPRKAVDKYGCVYVNFAPAVSREALKAMQQTIRGWHLQLKCDSELGRPVGPVQCGPARVARVLQSVPRFGESIRPTYW